MARDRTRKRIRDGLLDELLESCDGPEDVLGKDGLIRQLTGRLVDRVLDAELTDHLGYDKHSSAGNGSGNSRNGYRKKTLRDDTCSASTTSPLQRQLEFPIGSLSSGTQSPGDLPGAGTAPDPPSRRGPWWSVPSGTLMFLSFAAVVL